MDNAPSAKEVGISILKLAQANLVRIIAFLLLLAGCLFLAIAQPYPLSVWLFLLCPPMIGALIAVLSYQKVSIAINGQDERFQRGCESAQAKGTKFAKTVTIPVCRTGRFIWKLGRRLSNEHIRAAARITMAAYFLGIWGLAVAVAAVIVFWLAVAGLVFMIVIWILADGSTSTQTTSSTTVSIEGTRVAPARGRFWRGTSWWNEELAGRVDEDGVIYRGASWISEERIGRIDEDGRVYRGTSFWNEEEVGRIEEDGTIFKGSNWLSQQRVGRVMNDGEVRKGSNWWNEERVGRIKDD